MTFTRLKALTETAKIMAEPTVSKVSTKATAVKSTYSASHLVFQAAATNEDIQDAVNNLLVLCSKANVSALDAITTVVESNRLAAEAAQAETLKVCPSIEG